MHLYPTYALSNVASRRRKPYDNNGFLTRKRVEE
jgi:hypothetical protein